MDGKEPLAASVIRWALIMIGVGLLAAGGAWRTGADTAGIVWTAVLAAVPVMLGALGYGAYDQKRYNAVKAGMGRPKASDITPPAARPVHHRAA
jgi:hypothetical protein